MQAQEEFYRRQIHEKAEWELAEIYKDNGISGTDIKRREGFVRLISDCKAGKIDLILVKSVSRFARNTLDLLRIVRYLKQLGVSVRFEELSIFGQEMDKVSAMNADVIEKSEMILRQFCVDGQSPFLNKTLKEAGIREKYHCLIAGVERGGETLHAPDPHEPFVEGDVVWIVGESVDVYKLVGRKCEGFDMG